jgi:hypothetical protein
MMGSTMRRALGAIPIVFILGGCAVQNAHVQVPAVSAEKVSAEKKTPTPSLPVVPDKPPAANTADSKLDAALLSLSQASKAGTMEQKVKDLSAQLDLKEGKVKVEIVAVRTDPIASLKEKLAGAKFEMTAELENHLWGYLPIAAIEQVSRMDQVWTLSAATPSVSAR